MESIGRGTTPRHKFKVTTDLTEATVIFISYSQNGEVIFEKTIDDVLDMTEEYIVVKLTQADTLALSDRCKCEIQIRAGFGGSGGDRIKSDVMYAEVDPILKDGEI